MANEHLRAAASNIQRAVQDARDAQKRIHGEIKTAKRESAKAVTDVERQLAALEKMKYSSNASMVDKTAITTQEKALQAQISKIQADTEQYVADRDHEIQMFDGQAIEFEGLASHLNTIA